MKKNQFETDENREVSPGVLVVAGVAIIVSFAIVLTCIVLLIQWMGKWFIPALMLGILIHIAVLAYNTFMK